MEQIQLERKIEHIEQRLLVLEGAYVYRPCVSPKRDVSSSAWEKTYGVLSSRRAASFVRKIRENRASWSKTM